MKTSLTTNRMPLPRKRTGAVPNAPSKHDSACEAIAGLESVPGKPTMVGKRKSSYE
jgi:hypothetical protein